MKPFAGIGVEILAVVVLGCCAWIGLTADAVETNQMASVKPVPEGAEVIVLGAGCFWCTEAVFQQIPGVLSVTPGYMGGHVKNPTYEMVCTGDTGHAEVARVVYNPKQIALEKILDVFWEIHDPTSLNRQWNDVGTQYRSAIFYANDEQRRIAEAYIAQLDKARVFPRPLVTKVVPLQAFYPAEAYHQNYAALHPSQPYIMYNDAPKVEHLRQEFPDLYTGK